MTTNFVDKSLTNYLLCPCPPAFILSHFHTLYHCKVEWNRLCRSHATLPGTTNSIALACKYVYMYVYDIQHQYQSLHGQAMLGAIECCLHFSTRNHSSQYPLSLHSVALLQSQDILFHQNVSPNQAD